MSVRVMSLVWDNFRTGGSEKLVMLAMADWCNDEGGSLHPSNMAVAKKCCISKRQAQRVIDQLTHDGWLSVVGNASGGAPGDTKQYRMNVEKLRQTGDTHVIGSEPERHVTGDICVTGVADDTGDKNMGRRVTSMTQTGDTYVTQTTIDPSITTNSKSAPATRLPQNWVPSEVDVQFCKTTRPDLNASEVADSFRDYWIAAPGAKGKKQDWPATWRNWVRNQRRVESGRCPPKQDNFESRQYGQGGKL